MVQRLPHPASCPACSPAACRSTRGRGRWALLSGPKAAELHAARCILGRHFKVQRPPCPALQPAAGPSVWDTFTRYPNTLYRGPDVLAWGAAGSEGECATACSQQQGCQQWTWCPTDAGDSG